jgi:hypothetical protein
MHATQALDDSACMHRVGRYANVFRVGCNAFETVIEFGEQYTDVEPSDLHTRIVVSPVFARALANSLIDALQHCPPNPDAEPLPE